MRADVSRIAPGAKMIQGRAALLCAALLAPSASFAADLPLPAEADEFVQVCNVFGAGYFYIPNTDTCLAIGGYARFEQHRVEGDVDVLRGVDEENFNNWTSRARANAHLDARTQSALGMITTYIEFQMSVGPADTPAVYDETEVELALAYVEIANDFTTFTAGHTSSFFDFYGSDDYGTRVDIDDSTTEQTLFAMSLSGPQGLRGTLSIEDPASSGRRLNGADDHEGQELPDLVGNVRLEGDWGAAQAMGVVRYNHDVNGSALGFALGFGFSAKLPFHDIGFSMQANYADGALGYITTDPGGLGDFGGPTAEESTQAWNARAGFLVPVSERLSAWLDGSFTHAENDANDDAYDYWAVVAGAEYAPNGSIAFGPEFAYNNIDGDDPGEDGDIFGFMWRTQANF
jgi:hypothetical protein